MSDIDDLIQGMSEKAEVQEALDASRRGILIVEDEDGEWDVKMFGMTWGELTFAMAIANTLLMKNLLKDDDGD